MMSKNYIRFVLLRGIQHRSLASYSCALTKMFCFLPWSIYSLSFPLVMESFPAGGRTSYKSRVQIKPSGIVENRRLNHLQNLVTWYRTNNELWLACNSFNAHWKTYNRVLFDSSQMPLVLKLQASRIHSCGITTMAF